MKGQHDHEFPNGEIANLITVPNHAADCIHALAAMDCCWLSAHVPISINWYRHRRIPLLPVSVRGYPKSYGKQTVGRRRPESAADPRLAQGMHGRRGADCTRPIRRTIRGGVPSWLTTGSATSIVVEMAGNDSRTFHQGLRVLLVDPQMNLRLVFPEDKTYFGPTAQSFALQALRENRVVMSDLHRSRFPARSISTLPFHSASTVA